MSALQRAHGLFVRVALAGRRISSRQLRLFFARRPKRTAPADLRRVRIVEYEHAAALAPSTRTMRSMLVMWVASFAVHLLMLYCMTAAILPETRTAEVVEWVVEPAAAEAIDFSEPEPLPILTLAAAAAPLNIQPAVDVPGTAAPMISTAMDMRPDAERNAGAVHEVESLLASKQGVAQINAPGTGAGAAAGDASEKEEAVDEDAGAQFFGVQAKGNRFVFVVDCSLSMVGDKWATACRELSASIDRLSPAQHFYVVFFDGKSHRMFSDRGYQKAMLPATEDNIRRLRAWLGAVRLGYNTSPCLSVMFALSLKPDAIFLLSDGEFSDPTAAKLRKHNRIRSHLPRKDQPRVKDGSPTPAVAVHTIGFRSLEGKKMLTRIARENGGTYRYVP